VTRAPILANLVLWAGALAAQGSPDQLPSRAGAQAAHAAPRAGDPGAPDRGSVKSALRGRDYPWYDSEADRVRPVWPARWAWLKSLRNRIVKFFSRLLDWLNLKPFSELASAGSSIGTILLIAVLAAFLAALLVLWLRGGAGALSRQTALERLGTAARIAQLPEGIRPGGEDPWAEALKRRAAGDLSGAIVCVFAHQLLTLDREGLIRLVPGRTGRQYVQGLRDPDLVDVLGETLGLFEEVYYGRRRPTVPLFERVWSRAEAFRQRHGLVGVLE
jgi:hypothetical protein